MGTCDSSPENRMSVNRLLTAIFLYSSVFFAAGLIYDIVLYLLAGTWYLCIANAVSLLLMGGVLVLYLSKRMNPDISLFTDMLVITLNISFSIIYESIASGPDASFRVLLGMCICTLPIIMASLTGIRSGPLIITLLIICSYSVAAIFIGDEKLFLCMPILMLIYIGAPIALKGIIILSRRLERERIAIAEEKSEFLRIMNIEAERFDLLGAKDTKEAARLLDELDVKIRETLVAQVKHVITSEECIRRAIREHHPGLTDAEMEICVLIVSGKTVSEICEIRHVSPSTVTSIRSRLRKKIGLAPGDSLKSYLKSIANLQAANPE